MMTEDEARRMAAILTDTVGRPIDERLALIQNEIPRANHATIRLALQTLIDIKDLELSDSAADLAGLKKQLSALKRAEELSGKQDMSVAEAEVYLTGLAEAGSQEAKKLIDDLNDPSASIE